MPGTPQGCSDTREWPLSLTAVGPLSLPHSHGGGGQAQWEVEVGGEECREHPLRGIEQAGSLSRAGCTGPGRACPPAGLWGAPLGRLGWECCS